MNRFEKRTVVLLTSLVFVAAILCGTLHAVQPAKAAEMPDCHSQGEGADPYNGGGASKCPSQSTYGFLPKQTNVQPHFSFFTHLFEADESAVFLSAVAHHRTAVYFKPKAKTHLFNSVLTL
jgi:hypothetical protein